MDIKQIKQIIDLMKRSELTEFAVEDEGFKLKIRRGFNGQPMATQSQVSNLPFVMAAETTPTLSLNQPVPESVTSTEDEEGITYIKSPMVGTFYRSASPDSKSFVDDNSKVTETSVICIIEAMKIMNEIQAEVKGTILEAVVENGQPVEYGQRLFKVKQG
uniref:acetyl-CoA carboxylase biotin carboxyl carrier protein n=1 Tax=Cephaloticoccus sp. TaxID=1985742 RepID=UPI00404ABB61